MENDDRQIGKILSRRDALKVLGLTGVALLAACAPEGTATSSPTSVPVSTTTGGDTAGALPACVVRPEVTEGPYYMDEDLDRSDIRSDPASGVVKDGALLALTFNVLQVSGSGCTPLEGAKVDVWHCDADGVYSDVSDPGFNTKGQKFLRGFQTTDANGQAAFTTIYPGWYPGRTVHIHFKVHHDGTDQNRVFTSQLFFDDALTDQVFALEPYASKGQRNTLNRNDMIYQDALLTNVTPAGDGYTATFDIGLQLD